MQNGFTPYDLGFKLWGLTLGARVSNAKSGVEEEGVLAIGRQGKRRTVESCFQQNKCDFRRELSITSRELGSLTTEGIQSELMFSRWGAVGLNGALATCFRNHFGSGNGLCMGAFGRF